MSEMFVVRRANGDIFTEEIDGKPTIPVWSSVDAIERYKERNPELITFIGAPLTRSLIGRIGNVLAAEGTPRFFLLAEDDPDADLDDGRPISVDEIFPQGEHSPTPAQLHV
jgi:hypothetical protein